MNLVGLIDALDLMHFLNLVPEVGRARFDFVIVDGMAMVCGGFYAVDSGHELLLAETFMDALHYPLVGALYATNILPEAFEVANQAVQVRRASVLFLRLIHR